MEKTLCHNVLSEGQYSVMDGSDRATYNEKLVDSKDFSFSDYEECEYSVFYLCSNLNENDVADGEEKHKSSSIRA